MSPVEAAKRAEPGVAAAAPEVGPHTARVFRQQGVGGLVTGLALAGSSSLRLLSTSGGRFRPPHPRGPRNERAVRCP